MNELSTAIKFVSAGNGWGSVATDSATSSVATGDITMLIAGILALLIGAFAIWATVTYRKKAVEGAHVEGSTNTCIPLIVAAVAIVLGLSLTIASTSSMKAHADAALSSSDCIATVDEQTGAVTFNDIAITNNTEAPQVIDAFELNSVEGINGLDDAQWTFKTGDTIIYTGPVNDGSLESIKIAAGESVKISVSVANLSADVAKSLINKDVATADWTYGTESYLISAFVDATDHGTISYSPESLLGLDVPYGTAYTVSGNIITFGKGDDAQTITFTPESGYKLTNWTLNGTATTGGNVISDLAFVANTESAAAHYSGTVQTPENGKDTGLDEATVKFMSGSTLIDSTTTKDGGKYTFTKASVGTEGTIEVTKSASTSNVDDYGYSTCTIDVDTSKAEQATAHIGKIQSLAVKVYQYDSSGTSAALRDTYWCPAFSSDSKDDTAINVENIKFYEGTSSTVSTMITPTDANGYYTLSELANSSGTTADTRMKAKYFAICKAGNTLKCYQTADYAWNSVFQEKATESEYPKLGEINSSFHMSSITNSSTAKLIHFDESSDSASWTTAVKTNWWTASCPTLNGVSYSTSGGSGGWFGAYGGYAGGVLSYYSDYPWSGVASSGDVAFLWDVNYGGWSNYERASDDGVVLSQAFSS